MAYVGGSARLEGYFAIQVLQVSFCVKWSVRIAKGLGVQTSTARCELSRQLLKRKCLTTSVPRLRRAQSGRS